MTLASLWYWQVSILLYGFRQMYGEAITALPLNGGSYNVLINTTSKVSYTSSTIWRG